MLNLQTLLLLRSVGIAAQLLVILLAHYGFDIRLPLPPLLLILGLLAGWNLYSRYSPRMKRHGDKLLFPQLLVDISALGAVLYFTGGATNPFTWLFLLPIVIAATTLPALQSWALALLTILIYSLLMRYYQPLEYGHDGDNRFNLHVFGMWFGFMFSAVTVAWFIGNMARNLRQRDQRLAEAREQQLRDERLIALGTLATGAAHELGTPLATMAIVCDELLEEHDPAQQPNLHHRIDLLRQQVRRCKAALSTLSASSGEVRADAGEAIAVRDYLRQVLRQWQAQRPGIPLQSDIDPDSPAITMLADQTLSQALINILNNAADANAARPEAEAVGFHARWDREMLEIRIEDQGPGLPPPAAEHIGKQPYTSKQQGLGLGLFLAHATIGRLGGDITLFNRETGGLCTRILLPLTSLDSLNP